MQSAGCRSWLAANNRTGDLPDAWNAALRGFLGLACSLAQRYRTVYAVAVTLARPAMPFYSQGPKRLLVDGYECPGWSWPQSCNRGSARAHGVRAFQRSPNLALRVLLHPLQRHAIAVAARLGGEFRMQINFMTAIARSMGALVRRRGSRWRTRRRRIRARRRPCAVPATRRKPASRATSIPAR